MRTPLLLLHGFPMDARMWRPLVERFQHERVVVTPNAADLLMGDGPPTIERMAKTAVETLESTAPGAPAVVVGLSMGGYVALEIARRFPDRVAGLVLADTRATADTEDGKAARNAMIEAVRAEGVMAGTRPLREKLLAPNASERVIRAVNEIIEEQDPDAVVACLEAMRDRADTTNVLKAFAAPVLVVRGTDDALIAAQVAEETARLPANGRLETIRRAGHVPPMEYPFGFNAALTDFLRGLAG